MTNEMVWKIKIIQIQDQINQRIRQQMNWYFKLKIWLHGIKKIFTINT